MSDKYVITKSLLDNLNDTISERTGETKKRTIPQMGTDVSTLSPESSPTKPGWTNYPEGTNLGTSITEAQLTAIRNGTFEGLGIGDYWVVHDDIYDMDFSLKIADFDYYYGKGVGNVGDASDTHHVVIVTAWPWEQYMMDIYGSAECAQYTDSYLYTYGLNEVRTVISRVVGESHLVNMRKRIVGRDAVELSYEDTVWTLCASNVYGYYGGGPVGGFNPDDTLPFEVFATNTNVRRGRFSPTASAQAFWLTNFSANSMSSWTQSVDGQIFEQYTQETSEYAVAFLLKG